MEHSEASKGMLEKLITNETLAKMTRGPHFSGKGGSYNGFRTSMLPPLSNGKTSPGLSPLSQSGSRCSNSEHPRRSVIPLKNAPGPPVNSSGTGVLKVKSCSTTSEGLATESKIVGGRGGRSRKRCRESEAVDVSNLDDRKDGSGSCSGDLPISVSENVEPTRRRRRGQGSRRLDKRNAQLPSVADPFLSKLKVTNSPGATGILDIYGLKSKPADVSRYLLDIPLDKLLSGDFERPRSSAVNDPGDTEGRIVIEKQISNVMQLLPKHAFIQKPFVEYAVTEDMKVHSRLILDLERPLQSEEEDANLRGQVEERTSENMQRTGSLDKARSKSLELFPTFCVDDLPLYTPEVFMERLRLPANDPLETLISYAKPSGSTDTATEKSSRFEGIPPSPYSFSPCGVRTDADYGRAQRNGRATERHWTKGAPENSTKVLPRNEETMVKPEPPDLDVRNVTGGYCSAKPSALPIKPKGEQFEGSAPCDSERCEPSVENAGAQKGQPQHEEMDKEKVTVATRDKDFGQDLTGKGCPVYPDLPSLQVKLDNETSQSRPSSSNSPAMPSSPGVHAAALLLCNMANSEVEKNCIIKGKRQRVFPGEPSHRVSKAARPEDRANENGQDGQSKTSKEGISQSTKKIPVSEKRKSLSQVDHSLSFNKKSPVSAPLQGSGSWPRDSGGVRSNPSKSAKADEHRDSTKELGSLPIQVSSKLGSHGLKAKDNAAGKVKLNGVVSSSLSKDGNGNGCKSPKVSKRETSVSKSRCFVSTEPVASLLGPRTTVSIKSSRRTSFAGEGKQRSKHDLRASKLNRD